MSSDIAGQVLLKLCSSDNSQLNAGVPSVSSNLMVQQAGYTFVRVSWTAPLDTGGRTDTYYTVRYRKMSASAGPWSTQRANATNVELGWLIPATEYVVQIVSENGVSHLDPDSVSSRTLQGTVTTDSKQFKTVKLMLRYTHMHLSLIHI